MANLFFEKIVLHLGNVFFHRKALKHGQEGVEMGSDAEVRWVSHLLQLRTDGIVSALTTKTTVKTNSSFLTFSIYILIIHHIYICRRLEMNDCIRL